MGGGGDDGALSEAKDGGCPCIAIFCAECNCLMCASPCIAGHAKICCCELTLKSECPCISFDSAACYSRNKGAAKPLPSCVAFTSRFNFHLRLGSLVSAFVVRNVVCRTMPMRVKSGPKVTTLHCTLHHR